MARKLTVMQARCVDLRARSLITRCLKLLSYTFVLLSVSAHVSAQDVEPPAYNPQQSIARNWNEALLFSIRRDFARPTVHARNLFHSSAVMYDSWALYEDMPSLFFLGRTTAPDNSALTACALPTELRQRLQNLPESEVATARHTTLSFAMYRLLLARFGGTTRGQEAARRIESLFMALGFDSRNDTSDISASADPAAIGNYLAKCVIAYGKTDGSNEINQFENRFYTPSNPPMDPALPGNPALNDPNRWQPLELDVFVDQSGNRTSAPGFLSAEWSEVTPFALTDNDITLVARDRMSFPAYLDPGPPALISDSPSANEGYLRGNAMVALWSSHLDPSDGVMWDISPGNLGNVESIPARGEAILDFYHQLEGGSQELGYAINPVTLEPYAEERVPRGDFTRVLAEFWADGPQSETPPGHWFQIYNSMVSDHPLFMRPMNSNGEPFDALEFDIRTYFALGAAMHDSAIAAWSVKAAYDYIRPISALRYMADQGQSTDPTASNYSVHGMPLVDGLIETVQSGDPLAGNGGVNIGKIKARTWRGPDFVTNKANDVAGVGWILLENWWPYQQPVFVTPPFAGYVSGHSTFSRAASDVLTSMTGSKYFPGGLATFTARKDEFLDFERGPSVDVTLQWASYRDASDQTSLSRIWGGIHPPVDDIAGRRIGSEVAEKVLAQTQRYFDGEITHANSVIESDNSISGCSIASASGPNGGNTLLWILAVCSLLLLNRHRILAGVSLNR